MPRTAPSSSNISAIRNLQGTSHSTKRPSLGLVNWEPVPHTPSPSYAKVDRRDNLLKGHRGQLIFGQRTLHFVAAPNVVSAMIVYSTCASGRHSSTCQYSEPQKMRSSRNSFNRVPLTCHPGGQGVGVSSERNSANGFTATRWGPKAQVWLRTSLKRTIGE
jgi:hypothetical protein